MLVSLVLTIGLPGCGKTDWAQRWLAADPGRRALSCRDDARWMFFRKSPPCTSEEEATIDHVHPIMVSALLRSGRSVCVHDTNLRAARVGALMSAAAYLARVTIKDFRDVPPARVLAQNELRRGTGAHVPREIIIDMALRHQVPGWGEYEQHQHSRLSP